MMSKYSDTSSLAVILEIPGLEKTLRIRWLISHPTLEFSIALSRTLPRSHLLSLSLSFFIVSLKCPLTESTLPYSWKFYLIYFLNISGSFICFLYDKGVYYLLTSGCYYFYIWFLCSTSGIASLPLLTVVRAVGVMSKKRIWLPKGTCFLGHFHRLFAPLGWSKQNLAVRRKWVRLVRRVSRKM